MPLDDAAPNQGDGAPLPVTPFLKIPAVGAPYLQGSKCQACDEVQVGERTVCPKCGERDKMQTIKLSSTGKLYNYTVVYRNFPGVPVPFVSAIVDLDGGGTLKGNLIEVDPDPAKLAFDMPVRVVIRDAGRKDKEGHSYLAYFFVPAEAG